MRQGVETSEKAFLEESDEEENCEDMKYAFVVSSS